MSKRLLIKTLKKAIKKVIGRTIGYIGVAIAVYEFIKCMWFSPDEGRVGTNGGRVVILPNGEKLVMCPVGMIFNFKTKKCEPNYTETIGSR